MVDKAGFSQRGPIYGGHVRLMWIAQGGEVIELWEGKNQLNYVGKARESMPMLVDELYSTRCPAGHKYSPLPVDNWWQKTWLPLSQARQG